MTSWLNGTTLETTGYLNVGTQCYLNVLENALLVANRIDDIICNVINDTSDENNQIFRNFKQLITSSITKNRGIIFIAKIVR